MSPNPAVLAETERLEKLRTQISSDIEVMHQKEASMREYEQKLRALVEQASNSQPPIAGTPYHPLTAAPFSIELEMDKFARANALLESARRALTDERLALKDREEKVMIREQEVARREAWVKAREQQILGKVQATAAQPADTKSAPAFTLAPFVAAKNLLSLNRHS
jgi:hypothetical protein